MAKKAIVVVWCVIVVGFRALMHPQETRMALEGRFLIAANRRLGQFQERWTETRAALLQAARHLLERVDDAQRVFSAYAVLLAYRKRRLISVCIVLFFAIPITSGILTVNYTVYEYSYHGRVLGVVKNVEEVQSAIRMIEGTIVEDGGKKAQVAIRAIEAIEPVPVPLSPGGEGSAQAIPIPLDAGSAQLALDVAVPVDSNQAIEIKKSLLPLTQTLGKIDTEEEVIQNIVGQSDIEVNAYQVAVNGVPLGIVGTQEDADVLLDRIKTYWLGNTDVSQLKEIGFAEDVSVEEVPSTLLAVEHTDDLFARTLGTEDTQALLNVRTVEDGYYTAVIDFETVYEDTDELFVGEEKIVTPGVPGTKNAYGEIVRVNGEVAAYSEQSFVVVQEATPAVVKRGTKPVPPSIGTGTFIVPIDGLVTSLYGPRWGRIHEGIDFGAPIGTTVRAADGGKVTEVGWDGSFGLAVTIDHGAGFSSLYAHLSRALVAVGDEVYQGEQIAASGNTGYSTGPHLHFGIYKFGHSEVTMDYLPDDMPLYLLSGVGHD